MVMFEKAEQEYKALPDAKPYTLNSKPQTLNPELQKP